MSRHIVPPDEVLRDLLNGFPDDTEGYGADGIGWKPSRVLVLHARVNAYDRHWYWVPMPAPGRTGDDIFARSAVALVDGLAPLGIGPFDIVGMSTLDSMSERWGAVRYPRDLSWPSLPVVGEPRYRLDESGHGPRLLARGPDLRQLADTGSPALHDASARTLAGCEVLVIDLPTLVEEALADVGNLIAERGSPPLVMHFDGRTVVPVDPARIAAARLAWSAHDRFRAAFVLNGAILLARALDEAAVLAGSPEKERKGAGRFFFEEAWDPLGIQILHRLADGPTAGPFGSGGDGRMFHGLGAEGDHAKAAMLRDAGLTEIAPEGDIHRFVWRGSGAYPAMEGPWHRIVAGATAEELLGGPRPGRGVDRYGGNAFFVVHQLVIGAGTAAYTPNGLAITEKGRRYLDLIGPETRDPDVLLRWRKPDGRIGGPEDIPAMDRWLNRVFRAVKRRVSGLPARPLAPPHRTVWNEGGTRPVNVHLVDRIPDEISVVAGRVLRLAQSEMLKPGFPADDVRDAIAADAEGRPHPLRVIRRRGVPFAVYAGLDITKDGGDDARARAEALVAAMPPAVRDWAGTSEFDVVPL